MERIVIMAGDSADIDWDKPLWVAPFLRGRGIFVG